MFDAFLEKYTLLPGFSKEDYCYPFEETIKKRMNDVYHKAMVQAIAKCASDVEDKYEEAKSFPPHWCVKERWSAYCDRFKRVPEFNKRSTAGKANHEKKEIQSCTSSKSHERVCLDLEKKLCR